MGDKLTGDITAAGLTITAVFLELPTLNPAVLLGMDILSKLGLQILLNGTDITPGRNKGRGATFAISWPIQMTDLEKEKQTQAGRFLEKHLGRFNQVRGKTPLIEHQIVLEDPTSVKQRYRPRNPAMQAIIDEELDKMLEEGVVRPSNSPWSSPVVINRRKYGKPRICIDFWKLNSVTRRDAYPLPQVNATLDKLRGARYLSTIDLKNGYWHVPLAEDSKPLTAFTVYGRGLFKFNVMPFGLHSAPSTFQRLLNRVITPDMAAHAFAYLDDIVVYTATYEKHLEVHHQKNQYLYAPTGTRHSHCRRTPARKDSEPPCLNQENKGNKSLPMPAAL